MEKGKVYTSTTLNTSQVISLKAGAALEDVRAKGLKITDGAITLAGTGEDIIGVGLITNDENLTSGADVDIQIKDIGMVEAGAAVKMGDQLTVDATGRAVKATAGNYIFGIALEDGQANQGIRFMMARLGKAPTA